MTDQQGSPPDPPLGIDLQGLDQVDLEYVNIIQVNPEAHAFQIAFARFVQPMMTRAEEQEAFRRRVLEKGIPAQAVSHLLIVPSILREMVDVLQQQLAQYEQQYGSIPRFQPPPAPQQEGSNGS